MTPGGGHARRRAGAPREHAGRRRLRGARPGRRGRRRADAVRGSSELDFDTLPASIATIVRSAYSDATGRIFMIAAAMALISLISVLFVKEVPLRKTVRKAPAAAADDGSAPRSERTRTPSDRAPALRRGGLFPSFCL